jgi:hypothetical protein
MHRITDTAEEIGHIGAQIRIGVDNEKIAHSVYHTPMSKMFKIN